MLSGLFEIFLGIVGLSIVVIVHESGHFLAARATGIQVEDFSIGFGKRLFGIRKNGTDFKVSLIPLGGYCRFAGEQSFREALEQKLDRIPGSKGDFYEASPWKRIIVAFSGPLANIVFAILVFTFISWFGYQEYYTEPKIILASEWSDARESWPSDRSGLQSGDLITAVEGRSVDRFHELRRLLVFRPDELLHLTVLRDRRKIDLEIIPELDRETGVAIIGVLNWVDPVLSDPAPGSAAEMSGLMGGDTVVAVDGKEIHHSVGFYSAIADYSDQTTEIGILRNGSSRLIRLDVPANKDIGIAFQILSGRSVNLGFFTAFAKGITETSETLTSTLKGLRMLFLGIEIQNAVSGPVRLITDTGAIVADGFRAGFGPGMLWSFELMALISVSLAFLNLLPIPVLDGGQILLFCLEGIRNRPINPKSVYRYQFVGTIIVLIIAIAATTGDLIHFRGS